MYFPSLSIITTLACAALSVAAPLPDAPTLGSLEAAVVEIKEKFQNTARDVPAAPAAAPKVPLSGTFIDLLNQIAPVVTEISQCCCCGGCSGTKFTNR